MPLSVDLASHDLVFVAGLHRSGTSLVADLIASHPDASGLSGTGAFREEGQHVQDVYPAGSRAGGAGRFAFDERMHLSERDAGDAGSRAEKAERLLACWAPYWDLSRRVLVEKSPPNILKTRYLRALFPSARFVLVKRHPIAVALATTKWSHTSRYSLVAHWLAAHEIAAADTAGLEQVVTLRYEDLVAAPETQYASLLAFLGLDAQPAALAVRSGVNEAYYRAWEKGGPLKRRSSARAVRDFAARVVAFDYSLKPPYLPAALGGSTGA